MGIIWDGITQAQTLDEQEAQMRHALADAAKYGDWPTVLESLSERREWINSTRPGGPSWYAPLHQAARIGVPVKVAEQLVALGAWRTHQNAQGERPVDVAKRRGHRHLLEILTPQYKHMIRTSSGGGHSILLNW